MFRTANILNFSRSAKFKPYFFLIHPYSTLMRHATWHLAHPKKRGMESLHLRDSTNNTLRAT